MNNTLIFEKIIPTSNQVNDLYELLSKRIYSISHYKLPSKEEHREFVLKNPYLYWYLIKKNDQLHGSLYLQSDNSIGIDFSEPKEEDLIQIFSFIKSVHQPLAPIKSLRRNDFFINVASNNHNLINLLKQMEKKEIQRSFII